MSHVVDDEYGASIMRDSFGHMLLRVAGLHIRPLALCCGFTGLLKAARLNRSSWFALITSDLERLAMAGGPLSYLRSGSNKSTI